MGVYLWDNRRLERWYKQFNKQHFSGELPHDVDILWSPIGQCCANVSTLYNDPESYVMQISPTYAITKGMAQWALIHEMAHIRLWPYITHGNKFQAEMVRLAQSGAFRAIW